MTVKAGDTVICLVCDGRGYQVVREPFSDVTNYPKVCRGCGGTGQQTVHPV